MYFLVSTETNDFHMFNFPVNYRQNDGSLHIWTHMQVSVIGEWVKFVIPIALRVFQSRFKRLC